MSDRPTRTDGRTRYEPEYRGASVLVTGGTGFIGGAITDELVSIGANVHLLSRGHGRSAGAQCHAVDVSDASAVAALVRKIRPRVLFHLAGRTGASKSIVHVKPTFETNAVGTLNVLSAVADGSPECRVVCSASMEELWGDNIGASSPYGLSKRVASMYAALYDALYGISVVSLRPFFVYGPGSQASEKLVPHIIHELAHDRVPQLKSTGRAMDWVYLADVIGAFVAAGVAPTVTSPEPIDIGTGILTTIAEATRLLATAMNKSLAGLVPDTSGQPELSPAADLVRARAELSWQATTSLDAGVRATVAWHTSR